VSVPKIAARAVNEPVSAIFSNFSGCFSLRLGPTRSAQRQAPQARAPHVGPARRNVTDATGWGESLRCSGDRSLKQAQVVALDAVFHFTFAARPVSCFVRGGAPASFVRPARSPRRARISPLADARPGHHRASRARTLDRRRLRTNSREYRRAGVSSACCSRLGFAQRTGAIFARKPRGFARQAQKRRPTA